MVKRLSLRTMPPRPPHDEYMARGKARKAKVLDLVAKGLPQSEIAKRLGITQPRVSQIVTGRSNRRKGRARLLLPREAYA